VTEQQSFETLLPGAELLQFFGTSPGSKTVYDTFPSSAANSGYSVSASSISVAIVVGILGCTSVTSSPTRAASMVVLGAVISTENIKDFIATPLSSACEDEAPQLGEFFQKK
jgi:hypothetical protein